MATVSAHVAHTLAVHIDHVYGVMGHGNAYILDTLIRHTPTQFTPVRHEAGGVVAADAYYRAGGGLAAATATYGAGFTNTLTALAEAVQARTPLVLVVGDEPTEGPRPWDVDQISLAAGVGARTYTVGRTDAVATTVIAIEHALTYSVPTVLAIPYDVARHDAGDIPPPPPVELSEPMQPSADFGVARIEKLAHDLGHAQRPLLLAGRGAHLSGASDALAELADVTGAITATTALGRSVFPHGAFDLGVVGGFGAPEAMDLIRQADVVVVVGASLNQFTMRFGQLFSPTTQVVQIDTSPGATHPHVSGFIQGDAHIVTRRLVEAFKAGEYASSRWREQVDIEALLAHHPGIGQCLDGRMDPRSAASRLGELLPHDRVVVSDGGHFIAWANMYWPVAQPNRMIMVGTAFQAIGQGFPSVPGAAHAQPDSTIVLSTGDGGGLMALADLETAIRVAGGRGLVTVWNDAAYGAEIHVYGSQGLAPEPMLIPRVNFAEITSALGGKGVVIDRVEQLDVVGEWAAQAVDQRPFLLLDLQISPEVRAPYQEEIIAMNTQVIED